MSKSLTPGHVEVRVRTSEETSSDSKPFTLWPLNDLDAVIGVIQGWSDDCQVVGQFAFDSQGAWFFEVIVSETEA